LKVGYEMSNDVNNEDFFNKWYEYFAKFASNKLSRYSGRYVAPTDPEALDYVHDAFMKSNKIGQISSRTPYDRFEGTETNRKTWFCVLIDNCMKDKFKKAHNRLEMSCDMTKHMLNIPHKCTMSNRNKNVIELLKVLKPLLPDIMYKVVLLRSVSLTYSEIGGILGVPEGTTASRVNKIKTIVRSIGSTTDFI
jgi:DNA-directed RNA polymerase specialized sigma24 family protein